MSNIRHLVFSPAFQGLKTVYHVKQAGANALLFEAIAIGFWLNSLDVFQGAVSEGRKSFTIKPYRNWWLSHHVFVSDDEVLGTVMRESRFSRDWVIMDASTRIVSNIHRKDAHRINFFGEEYQFKINESVIATLKLKRTLLYYMGADLCYSTDATEQIDEKLLISSTFLIWAAWQRGF